MTESEILVVGVMVLQVVAAVCYLSARRRGLRVAATVLFGLALFATVRTIDA